MVRLHSEEERVRTERPGAASAPAMPHHNPRAAPERRLLPFAVTAAPPRGHHQAVRPASRSSGHKDVSTSSQGSIPGRGGGGIFSDPRLAKLPRR